MRLSQQNSCLNKILVPSTFEAVKMYEELDSNLSGNSSFGWHSLVRSFLANQPTKEAIFADIVHGHNETLKVSIEYFHNLTTSL